MGDCVLKTERTGIAGIAKQREAPELVIHTAASLVSAGDPFSLNPEERQDKAGEICQFCVQVPSKFVGKLKKHNIEEAFYNMMQATLKKLREHGVMGIGE